MTISVLFSSAGRRVELINCFREDAVELGIELRVLAADFQPELSAACQVAEKHFAVPRCDNARFVPRMQEICAGEHVDLVIPTIDPELAPLAAARAAFAAAGTRLVVSGVETVAIARDKLRTAAVLSQHGIPFARSVALERLIANPGALRFPVVLKPVDGSASIGLREARDTAEIERAAIDVRRYLAQEKWTGREYTVNLFVDRSGRLRSAVPHWRREIRAGEVSKGRTERVPQLIDLAGRIASALPDASGPLCFQAIVTESGQAVVFEINARFGGGYPLAHRAGARFSRWLLEEAAEMPSTADVFWQEGVTMLRYDAAVFSIPGKK